MSTTTQKPKLTGWAAAAAKAAPAAPAAQPTSTSTPTATVKPNKTAKSTTSSKPQGNNNSAPASTSRKSKKPASKPAFNSDQVLEFLHANYTNQANAPNTVLYSKHASNSPPDWGITTNNRWKSKKYVCLGDVARSLKN
ncbi:LAFA_0D09736g1_1 [Lachancea sp. 'fantastica']|nr:LAFA_0D09736g1_1 [Lachancea sp. 'fantastica']